MSGPAAKRYRWSLRRYLAPEQLWLPPDPAVWLPSADPPQKPRRHLAAVPLDAVPTPATTPQPAPLAFTLTPQPSPTPKRQRTPTDRQRKCSPHRRARTIPATGRVLVIPYIRAWEAAVRPKTRGDCLPGGVNAARPCPFISCRHNLATEVNEENGSLKIMFPDADGGVDWDVMPESCSLDVADRVSSADKKELELEQIGRLTNRSRERIYQLSNKAQQEVLAKMRRIGG